MFSNNDINCDSWQYNMTSRYKLLISFFQTYTVAIPLQQST